jgi:hypothetical protein
MELDPLTDLQKSITTMRSSGFSWEAIGCKYGINRAMARLLGNGYIPGRKIRKALGLPFTSAVIVIGDGEVPDGSQAIQAIRCNCGQWFISNHPLRTHCFICRPAKQARRQAN